MRVFIVGDHRTGTGPANVTKSYIENFPTEVLYQKRVGKAARVPELFLGILRSDVVLFSGYSRQNILGMKLAARFRKPTAYLMHGCVEYENQINKVPDVEMARCEREMMRRCDRIFAVSERFNAWLCENYPEYSEKIDVAINGVDIKGDIEGGRQPGVKNIARPDDGRSTDRYIVSIGGGMPRKMIKYICKAVEKINSEGESLKLVVVGDVGFDSEEIRSCIYCEDRGLISHDDTMKLLEGASLFVQNSCFETFGLAPIEAIMRRTAVLLSSAVGALDIINGVRDEDIINNYNDADEIAEKIKHLLQNSNAERLAAGIDLESCSWKARSAQLYQKLQAMSEN